MLRRGRRRLVFVPLAGANVGPAGITLGYDAELARRAPQARPGCELPAELEEELYRHFGLRFRVPDGGGARLHRVR